MEAERVSGDQDRFVLQMTRRSADLFLGWGRRSGGVALLNHRLQAGTLSGCDLDWCGFRRCRSWTRLTAGYKLSSLRDEEAGGKLGNGNSE